MFKLSCFGQLQPLALLNVFDKWGLKACVCHLNCKGRLHKVPGKRFRMGTIKKITQP